MLKLQCWLQADVLNITYVLEGSLSHIGIKRAMFMHGFQWRINFGYGSFGIFTRNQVLFRVCQFKAEV